MVLHDGNGNAVRIDGDVGTANIKAFDDGKVNPARQGNLTIDGGKLFYPIVTHAQIIDPVKMYDGGMLIAIGDSYTHMGGTYFQDFAAKHGLVLDNQGVSSSTIAGTPGASGQDGQVGYKPFWERIDQAVAEYKAGKTIGGKTYHAEDVKLVTFMGGANDWYTVKPDEGIDRLGNLASTDKAQLYGAAKYCFATILQTFVNADVVCILQPSHASSDGVYSMRLKEGIVRDCAEMYGVTKCDCIFEWYNPANPEQAAKYWQNDELHLTDDGNKALFAKLERTVNNLPFRRI